MIDFFEIENVDSLADEYVQVQVRISGTQLIKYAHNDLISDFRTFGIPDLKF